MNTDLPVSRDIPGVYVVSDGRRYRLDDKGSGELFAECCKDQLRFSPERNKWYKNERWTWAVDMYGLHAMEIAKAHADILIEHAMNVTDAGKKAALTEHVKQWQSRPYRELILKEAAGSLSVPLSEFDRDPYLLNLPNGVLDLREGRLRPGTPGDMLTKTCGAEYHAGAECPLFEAFIKEAMMDDTDLVRYAKKVLAYALTGDRRYNRIFIFEDADGDCRSRDILFEVMEALMGSYACQVNLTPQMEGKLMDGCGYGREMVQLAGVRFAEIFRNSKKVVLSPALVTRLTRTVSLTATYPGGNEFTFPVCFKAFISSAFTADGISSAFNPDKVNVIPLSVYSGDYAKLRTELLKPENLSGILNWILSGFSSLWADGLNPPEAVVKATEQLIRKPAA